MHIYPKRRLLWIVLGIFILFAFLVMQFYRIQILEGEQWLKVAQKQHFFTVKEPFRRGKFYSYVGMKQKHADQPQLFVIDVPVFHLYVDPSSIPTRLKDVIATTLMQKINLSIVEQLHFREQFDKQSRSRKLAMWLDQNTHDHIRKWWLEYARLYKLPANALYFVKDYKRSYPFGKLLGQVLHTIQSQKDEKTNQAKPTGGLELYFNSYLEGRQGKKRLMRSPRHAFEIGEVIAHPEHGADIYLTINQHLQAIVEEELEKGVKKSKGKSGWAGMMDPYTGEIWALAQYPFFHPADYSIYFNDKQLIEDTKVKAITDANEPGSVFKPFTAAIALKANQILLEKGEAPLFDPEAKMGTSNGHFPGRSKPITDTKLHYFLNLDMAMQKSSNIYMARLVEKIVQRLGSDWYRRQLQLFGFGEKTGIELPAESRGVLPTPGKLHPNGTPEWSIPTPFSIAFGHNIQVTTLQLLRAYAVLANGGRLVKPTLVRHIVKTEDTGKTHVILDHTQRALETWPLVLDAAIIKRVLHSMRYVTKPGGTAARADVPGFTEVGKTSTAKKIIDGHYSETRYFATFAGFTPVINPCFVLVISINEPEYGYIPGIGKNHNGGNCTADVFREISKRAFAYLGTIPDDPHGYPYGDPRHHPDKIVWMPETRILKEIYDKWNNSAPKSPSLVDKEKHHETKKTDQKYSATTNQRFPRHPHHGTMRELQARRTGPVIHR